ncbi:MAG TPA: hypothetical protein DCM40_40095 [Maribacter sp.]|nr:hypothetical protein [Maribacter sp.]
MSTKIKKLTLLIFFSIFLASCPTMNSVGANQKISPPTYSFVKIFNQLEIEECKAEKDNSGNDCPVGTYYSTGSGIAADIVENEMIVLTAGHVCEAKLGSFVTKYSLTITVMGHDGRLHQSNIIKSSFDNSKGSPDMCALYVPTLRVKKIQFSGRPPQIGDDIYYIGAPMGVYHNPVAPIFKGVYSGIIDPSSALVTAPAAGGSSGSAVLNYNDRIIGILYATHPRFHHVTVMTNYYATLLFIEKVKKDFNK